jgi:hypothetical protein
LGDEPCLHHHKTADVRLQHPIKLFGVNMTGSI